jgi:hypothetical protein
MNRDLASYLFASETIFTLKSDVTASEVETSSSVLEKNSSLKIEATEKVTLVLEGKSDVSKESNIIETSTNVDSVVLLPKITKNVIVIVKSLSENSKNLLEKILGSVKLDFDKVALIDIAQETPVLTDVLDNERSYKILSFGVNVNQLKVNHTLQPYIAKTDNQATYLLFDDLTAIETNLKDEKKLLWAAIKPLFS